MSEDVKLKPCPYCGGEATRTTMRKFKYVSCENNDCSMVVEAGALFSREEEAIAVWNTRPTEQTAYERGEAEERGRVAEALTGWMNASKAAADQWMNVNRTQFDLCYQTYDTLRQVIEIVNQVKE